MTEMDGQAAEIERLKTENAELALRLQQVTQEVAAEKGPPKGTLIHYRKADESFCRPGKVLSDGFTARVPGPGGAFGLHCHIEYGEHESIKHEKKDGTLYTPVHTWETDRPWSPLGAVETWHLPDECPYTGQAP